jgi:hypothetical protein
MVIDYDRAAADYEASLITKLRGHGAGSFLENWVPDPDPALGVFNMIEAAWTGGQHQIELKVSRATLDAGALERLKQIAGAIADLEVASEQAHFQIKARRASRARSDTRPAAATTRPKAAATPQVRRPEHERSSTPDLQPALVEALLAETERLTHEDASLRRGKVSLAIDDAGLIRAARHGGAQPDTRRRLVELMCREIEGRTVQDASDHAGVLVVHRLRTRGGTRPAAGILLPANAGHEVLAALELVRAACREHQARSGKEGKANFFELGPSAAWRGLPAPDKLRRTVQAAQEFCAAQGSGALARPVRIDKDIHGHEIRVIVQVDGVSAADGVPLFLRRLERYLKQNVEQALQVYLEPLKDKSVLRRL